MLFKSRNPNKIARLEVETELNRSSRKVSGFYEEKDFEPLPPLIRSHFIDTGFVGRPRASNLSIEYGDSFIKMNVKNPWQKVACKHYLFSNPNVRIVYLRSEILGVIPFEGRDLYKEGEGNMLGTMGRLVKLFDVRGPEMSQSALVTFLAEILFLPLACLSDQVKWQQLDSCTVKAQIEDLEFSVEGIFHFDEQGQLLKFTTDDRFEGKTPCPWTAWFEDYKEMDGLILPAKAVGTWNYPGGDFDYFEANFTGFTYNFEIMD